MTATEPRATTDAAALDAAVADLVAHKRAWVRRPIEAKIDDLERIVAVTERVASAWVDDAVRAKGITPGSPLAGEEWTSGPWVLVEAAAALTRSLRRLQRNEDPVDGLPLRVRADGRLVLDVFPADVFDRLLLSGYSAEVWMQRGVTPANLRDHVARAYRHPDPEGRVDVILGAGNIASIAPLDLLTKLFVEGAVGVVKLNPVNDYLAPHLEEIFAHLIGIGAVRIVTGGAAEGEHLVRHPDVDAVHITGSAATHDAIVYGAGEDGAARKAAGEPILDKPITSELGGVGAAIVVPGPWDDGDVAYQAVNLATMKLHNGGCNCIALQVLVLPERWERSDELEDEVVAALARATPRHPYYPGAADRRDALVGARPGAERLGAGERSVAVARGVAPDAEAEPLLRTEVFGPALATTRLPGDDPVAFLERAVRFCNDELDGTLGVNLLVHPATLAEHEAAVDRAVAELRYGAIGVNCWTGLAFLLAQLPWGAHPGHTLADIQSGRGVVHNSLLLSDTEKSVVRGPFRTFPRSVRHLDGHLATRPPWFVDHRQADVLGQRLVRFAAHRGWRALPALFPPALRG